MKVERKLSRDLPRSGHIKSVTPSAGQLAQHPQQAALSRAVPDSFTMLRHGFPRLP